MQRSRGLAEGWNVQPMPLLPKIREVSVKSRPTMVSLLDPPLRQLLTIATGNPIKVAEIEAMLGPLSVEVQRQPEDLDVEETGTTYLENAELKATAAALLFWNFTHHQPKFPKFGPQQLPF